MSREIPPCRTGRPQVTSVMEAFSQPLLLSLEVRGCFVGVRAQESERHSAVDRRRRDIKLVFSARHPLKGRELSLQYGKFDPETFTQRYKFAAARSVGDHHQDDYKRGHER